VTTALKAVPQQEFQKCFQQWQHRLTKSVAVEGMYFEGDPPHACNKIIPGTSQLPSYIRGVMLN